MAGQGLHGGVRSAPKQVLQPLRQLAVQRSSPGRRQTLFDGLPDEAVREPAAPTGLLQEPARHDLVQGVEQPALVIVILGLEGRPQPGQRDIPADDGGHVEQAKPVRGQGM